MAASAGVSMTVDTVDLGDVGKRLAAIVNLTAKPSKLMKAIGASLESSTKRRFRSNVGPDGAPWKPSVRARLKGGRTLFEHGHLRDSITSDGDDEKAVVGTNLIYGPIHQFGGVIRPKTASALTFNIPGVGWRRVAKVTIPARPYLGISNDDRDEIASQVERYIAKVTA